MHTKHIAQLETMTLLKGQWRPRESQMQSNSQFPFCKCHTYIHTQNEGPSSSTPPCKWVKQLQHEHPPLLSSHRSPARAQANTGAATSQMPPAHPDLPASGRLLRQHPTPRRRGVLGGSSPRAPGTRAPGKPAGAEPAALWQHSKPWRCPRASQQPWGRRGALQYLGERTDHTVKSQPTI